MKIIKCIVAAMNSNGEPDLYFCIVKCNEEQYDCGDHYDRAKEQCKEDGYEPYIAYDETDTAGKAMLPLFNWDTASILIIEN